jgi:hypothetical protein
MSSFFSRRARTSNTNPEFENFVSLFVAQTDRSLLTDLWRSANQDYNTAVNAAAGMGLSFKKSEVQKPQEILPVPAVLQGDDKLAKEALTSGEPGLLVVWGSNVSFQIICLICT